MSIYGMLAAFTCCKLSSFHPNTEVVALYFLIFIMEILTDVRKYNFKYLVASTSAATVTGLCTETTAWFKQLAPLLHSVTRVTQLAGSLSSVTNNCIFIVCQTKAKDQHHACLPHEDNREYFGASGPASK